MILYIKTNGFNYQDSGMYSPLEVRNNEKRLTNSAAGSKHALTSAATSMLHRGGIIFIGRFQVKGSGF